LFGPARALLGIASRKSRRPRSRLKVGKFENPDSVRMVYTDRGDHPGNLILEKLQPPRFLDEGCPTAQGRRRIGIIVKNIGGYPRGDGSHIELLSPGATYLDFTRLLAKIAHAYWIAEMPGAMLHPVLPGFIRGKSESEHDYFVGSNPHLEQFFDDLHHVESGFVESGGFQYGYVDIALFASYPPFNSYRVYVGSVGREMKFVWASRSPAQED